MQIELNEQQANLIKETLQLMVDEEHNFMKMSEFYKTVATQIIAKINERNI